MLKDARNFDKHPGRANLPESLLPRRPSREGEPPGRPRGTLKGYHGVKPELPDESGAASITPFNRGTST
jgi:hypothetical protein